MRRDHGSVLGRGLDGDLSRADEVVEGFARRGAVGVFAVVTGERDHLSVGGDRRAHVVQSVVVDLRDQQPRRQMARVEVDGLRAEDQGDVVAFFGGGEASPTVVELRFLFGVLARKKRGEMS